VPTETLPNRAFACAATSQGHMDDKTHTFSSPTIFGLLDAAGQRWAVYGYGTVSHLEAVRAELISRRYPAGVTAPSPPSPPGPLSA